MPSNDELNENMQHDLAELGRLRQEQAALDADYKKRFEEFQASNAELLARGEELATDIKATEDAIKFTAKELYECTQMKTLAGGVRVSVMSKPVYDIEKALVFCREHKLYLVEVLDKKNFEAMIKATPPDFVTFKDEIRVGIPSNIDLKEAP